MDTDTLPRLLGLPDRPLRGWKRSAAGLQLELGSVAVSACCPRCGQASSRRHGRYWRRLAECACLGCAVSLCVEVRRFRCLNADCPQRTFAEPLGSLAEPRCRRTRRLVAAHRALGLAVGGAAGARLAVRLGMPTSGDTLIRTLRRTPPSVPAKAAQVIGIDDWALARGHRYGTIVVDLERHRPIALLPDRSAETVAAWLRPRRGIVVIARDRAGPYAEAARQAAPRAVQVADRWHLLHNLRDALERLLMRRASQLRAAAGALAASPGQPAPGPGPCAAAGVSRSRQAEQLIARHRAERLARYNAAMRLHARGESLRSIADCLGLDRRTVRRFVRAGSFPERAARTPTRSRSEAVRPYLERRAAEGCRNARQLWRELVERGFCGGYSLIRHAFAALRPMRADGQPKELALRRAAPSPRRACRWILGWERGDGSAASPTARQRFVTRLCEIEPEVANARALALRFVDIVRSGRASRFARWLAQARRSGVVEMRRLAASLGGDLAAVHAAIASHWNSGQVEGQIHRLKMLKRQMYGRAKLDLLQIRLLQAA